jgi:hypothetical protein
VRIAEPRTDCLGAAAELDDAAAVALCWAVFGERSELLHGFVFSGFALAAFFAFVGFSIEGLGDCGGAANFRDGEDFDVEFAAFVLYAQHVADVNISRGLCFDFVGANAAEIAGLGGQGPGLEEAGGPEPFVDAYRFSELFGCHGIRRGGRYRA